MVVLKQFQNNLFHMLQSLGRISRDTGALLGVKGCFFPLITNLLTEVANQESINWFVGMIFITSNYISLKTLGRSKHKILNITKYMLKIIYIKNSKRLWKYIKTKQKPQLFSDFLLLNVMLLKTVSFLY